MNERRDKTRLELMELQTKKERNLVKAQEIVLKQLEEAIKGGDSATVAAMAEILKH